MRRRSWTAELAALWVVAYLSLFAGLGLGQGEQAWRSGLWGRATVVAFALGLLVLAPWPMLCTGFLAYVSGVAALGVAALRTAMLPPAEAVLLTVAAGLLLLFNL